MSSPERLRERELALPSLPGIEAVWHLDDARDVPPDENLEKDLVPNRLEGDAIGCLLDAWVDGNYRLFFVRFGLDWLTDEHDKIGAGPAPVAEPTVPAPNATGEPRPTSPPGVSTSTAVAPTTAPTPVAFLHATAPGSPTTPSATGTRSTASNEPTAP